MSPAAPLEPGTVLGTRYRILEVIGDGSSTTVYRADDLTLQRAVAVKVLHPEIAAEDEWRERFRLAVTAVSSLHHPNLVRVYDWGQAGEHTYVVCEYLPGGSLRAVLAQRGQLSREQTAMIGLEAADALAYAHARGFIHGSLRPSKILFDAEGRTRVGDLATASALAGAPRRARTLELARYSSPEQVTGQSVDGRTDVYTLALIMFECLTGEVPHGGASLESIRTNRIGAPLPHRAELGPFDLLLALGAAPEPSARPDASMFASRLTAVAATLPVPRPISADNEQRFGFTVPTPEAVLSAPATMARTGENPAVTDEVVRPFDLPGYRESIEPVVRRHSGRERVQRTNRLSALLAIIVVLALALTGGILVKAGVFTASHPVPNLIGLSQHDALTKVAKDGFTISVVGTAHSPTVPTNDIVTQVPSVGTSLKSGSTINVTLSLGIAPVKIPVITGLTCEAATALLASNLKVTCPTSRQVATTSVPRGEVVAWYHKGQKDPAYIAVNGSIELAISTGTSTTTTTTTTTSTTTTTVAGHPNRAVPNLYGDSPAQANAAMSSAELFYIVTPSSKNGHWTKIVGQSPAAGTIVAWHSSVTVTVQ